MSLQEQDRKKELLPDRLEEFKLSVDEIITVRGGVEPINNACPVYPDCWETRQDSVAKS